MVWATGSDRFALHNLACVTSEVPKGLSPPSPLASLLVIQAEYHLRDFSWFFFLLKMFSPHMRAWLSIWVTSSLCINLTWAVRTSQCFLPSLILLLQSTYHPNWQYLCFTCICISLWSVSANWSISYQKVRPFIPSVPRPVPWTSWVLNMCL